mgnify:CR=1 FL=1
MPMVKSKSSKRWLRERAQDEYVKKSKREGYRSRASFKLLEIQKKDRFIKRGRTVVDLGSAPGGWSQVAKHLVGHQGMVFASDILPMEPIPGVNFIQGDFTKKAVFEQLTAEIRGGLVDLVISDMAPNISGVRSRDQAESARLNDLAIDLVRKYLKSGGSVVMKTFQGPEVVKLVEEMKNYFSSVRIVKPKASRKMSSEVYVVAMGFRPAVWSSCFS